MERKGEYDEQYVARWAEKMVEIWRDRIALLEAVDTGRLFDSVGLAVKDIQAESFYLSFKFAEYGIFVDSGTGRGYTRGNGGDLKILNKDYRKQKGLGQSRKARPWLSTSWAISQRVLTQQIGEQYLQTVVRAFDELKKK